MHISRLTVKSVMQLILIKTFTVIKVSTGCGKINYTLKLLAIFWATAWNFNAKFHTLIS